MDLLHNMRSQMDLLQNKFTARFFFIGLFKANSLTVGVDRIEQKCSVLQDDDGI